MQIRVGDRARLLFSGAITMPSNSSTNLTPSEQRDFDVIVRSAKRYGWLDESYSATAAVFGGEVIVTFTSGSHVDSYTYTRDHSWPYRLLRDLVHGDIDPGLV